MVIVKFDVGYAWYRDSHNPKELDNTAVANSLRDVATTIELTGERDGIIRDGNGNRVGSWRVR